MYMNPAPIQANKRKLFSFLTAILSVSAVLIAGEMLGRLLLPFNTPDTMKKYGEPDLPLGLKPEARIVELDGGKALGTKPESAPSQYRYLMNNLGFRGPPFSPRKAKGV